MDFSVTVQAADVVVILLTPAWCASTSGRSDLTSTLALRLSAHEMDAVKPWQQAAPVVVVIGFDGVDWGEESVRRLVNINPSVKHDATSLLLGDVQASLFLLWRLVDQI
jgi:hypothetical protein